MNAKPSTKRKRHKDPTGAARQAAWRKRHAQSHAQALAAKGLPATPAISTMPGTARWKAQHALVLATLESMHDEMQSYFDDRSPTWQEDERGAAMSVRIEAIAELIAATEELDIA
jgi:hypothetical protein